jgi:translocation and assembly module TamA
MIALTGGYATGEGVRVEASWTHRNLFPPEGALTIAGVAGTKEQIVSATFRRSNAGRRDRSFELVAEALHSNYDAYSSSAGRLAARIAYDSTPIWQKRLTYAFGVQVLGTKERAYNAFRLTSAELTYGIAALSGQAGFDSTNSLLDPVKGIRLSVMAEPEASLQQKVSTYIRVRLDGSAYYPVSAKVVLAARVRVGSIQGVSLDNLAPSRRFFAGGGGSVRGFGYQQLGPRDPNGDPTGGRSLNEASLEVRYRFGDYGVVAFTDFGQAYQSATPRLSDLRAGVGLGFRVYTNFGPMRLDIATPLAPRPGEGRVNFYVSIGQAF